MPKRSEAPRVVGFDFGPPGPPVGPPAGATEPVAPAAPAAPEGAYPQAAAAYPPPGYGATAPEQPYAGAQPAPAYPPPGYGAAEPGYPPPGYTPPGYATPAAEPAPYGAAVATAPQPGYPPAYGGPGYPPTGAFPGPAWAPPAGSRSRGKAILTLAAVMVALVVVIGIVASVVVPDREAAAPAPRKPVPVTKLRTPKTIGSLPRMTNAPAKKAERGAESAFDKEQQAQFAWYGRGKVPTYELIAAHTGEVYSSHVLAEFSKPMRKMAKVSAPVAVGALTCERIAFRSVRASACAWAGPKSSGVLLWYRGNDVRKLAALTAKTQRAAEGR